MSQQMKSRLWNQFLRGKCASIYLQPQLYMYIYIVFSSTTS